jgi:predicted phage-related endonuclease
MKRLGHTTPHSPEWHAARRRSIGASEVAAVLGLGAYGSPAEVWAGKVGESAFEGNDATRIGTAMERRILDAAAEVLGVPVLDGSSLGQLAADETDLLTCHLDGWIEVPE